MVTKKYCKIMASFAGENLIEGYGNYEEVEAKLKVGDIFYKYRTHYKCVWNEKKESEQKILTFIMYNPSTANQYSLDPTLRNCLNLTQSDKSYDGFEVYNLITVRHPNLIATLNLYKKADDELNPLFNEKISMEGKHICIAWGVEKHQNKNFNTSKDRLINKVIEKFEKTKDATFYVYGEENTKEYKARHPSPQSYIKVKQPVLKELENIEELVR